MLPIKMDFLLFQAFHFSLSPPSLSLSLPPLSSCLSGRVFFYIFWLVVWLFGRLLLTEMHENRNTAKFIAHPLAAPSPLIFRQRKLLILDLNLLADFDFIAQF